MPFNRVERVEVTQSIIGRIFGIGNVVVDTGDDHVVLKSIRGPSKTEQIVSQCIRTGGPMFTRQSPTY